MSGSPEVVLDYVTHQRSTATMPMRINIAIVANRRFATLPAALSVSPAESSLEEECHRNASYTMTSGPRQGRSP